MQWSFCVALKIPVAGAFMSIEPSQGHANGGYLSVIYGTAYRFYLIGVPILSFIVEPSNLLSKQYRAD